MTFLSDEARHDAAVAAGALLLLAACAGGSTIDAAPSPFVAECPLPAVAVGYPVAAWSASPSQVDTAYLSAFARASAHRWRVPSRRRDISWKRVSGRVVPPEPRWADDWRPGRGHHAELAVWVDRAGAVLHMELRRPSGDELFDASLHSALDDPLPNSPLLPTFTSSMRPDSILVILSFGETPADSTAASAASAQSARGVARFAVHQAPARLVGGKLQSSGLTVVVAAVGPRPPPPTATVKYDVDVTGKMLPGSVEVLSSSTPQYASYVQEALGRAEFIPAQSNCRPVPVTVLQTIRGGDILP